MSIPTTPSFLFNFPPTLISAPMHALITLQFTTNPPPPPPPFPSEIDPTEMLLIKGGAITAGIPPPPMRGSKLAVTSHGMLSLIRGYIFSHGILQYFL